MKIKAKQLSLSDIYDDVQSFFEEDKPKFIKLFEPFVDLSELIPSSFMPTIIPTLDVIEIFLLNLCSLL
ncbi:hypothetical protein TheetDRAFT_3125 [Thermoanaerobacter ethanolicus JW 200]|nr:hypothetical protein TheetDRAFT_3125 [Thermoanaerobacter ethanolicus JW 200]